MTKDFYQDGKWIEKPKPTVVSLCACAGRFIKTRKGQTKCLTCMSREKGHIR